MAQWKFIENYDERYMVSDDGEIYSCIRGKLMTPQPSIFQYPRIGLWKGNKYKIFAVHRLVAIHFIPNPENKRCVNHINANRGDNRLVNLEWATHKENIGHAKSLNRHTHGESNSKLREADVLKIRRLHARGFTLNGIRDKIGGICSTFNIWAIVKRKTWTHL